MGKLRFSGFLISFYGDYGDPTFERISLFGIVNPTTGKIRLTKIGGIPITDPNFTDENYVLNMRILKRNDIVVGLNGRGSSSSTYNQDDGAGGVITFSFYDVERVAGYKTRELPE